MKSKGKIIVECSYCHKKENVFLSRSKIYKYCSKICMQKSYQNVSIKKGDKINNWIITSEILIRKHGRAYVDVICSCGSEQKKLLPKHHIETMKSNGCEKCSMFHTSTGYKLLSGDYWSLVINGAKKRNIDIFLSIKEAYELIEKQSFKCALSGLSICFNKNTTEGKKINSNLKTASLDRIDSKKGYYLNNVQWVHKDINIMKNKYSQTYFIEMCKLVSDNIIKN